MAIDAGAASQRRNGLRTHQFEKQPAFDELIPLNVRDVVCTGPESTSRQWKRRDCFVESSAAHTVSVATAIADATDTAGVTELTTIVTSYSQVDPIP